MTQPMGMLYGDPCAPAYNQVAVTPDDDDLIPETRGLYIGTAGDVTVLPAVPGATAVLYASVPGGTILPVRVVKVLDTGTDADDIVALF